MFWWEPLDMCRKLALTGWVMLIPDSAEQVWISLVSRAFVSPQVDTRAYMIPCWQGRTIVAVLLTVAYLSLHLTVKPLRRCLPHALEAVPLYEPVPRFRTLLRFIPLCAGRRPAL